MAHGELLIRIAEVTQQIKLQTNSAALYLQRGELHREDKDWNAAEADYTRAQTLDPKLAAVDLCRAQMLADSEQLQAARSLLNKIVAKSPQDGEAFVARAGVLARLNLPKLAERDFRRALALLPETTPELFAELAQTLIAQADTNAALRSLDDGIAKFGPIVPLQKPAIDLEFGQKNYKAALSRIDLVIEAAPRKENWLAQRGDILVAAGRNAEARKSFEEAIAAIHLLPMTLQKAPPMQTLQSRIDAALRTIQGNRGSQQ